MNNFFSVQDSGFEVVRICSEIPLVMTCVYILPMIVKNIKIVSEKGFHHVYFYLTNNNTV